MTSQPDFETPVPELTPASNVEKIAYIPALVSAAIVIGFMRSGFLSFLFLVPVGFMVYAYNFKSVWVSVLAAIVGNGIFSLVLVFLGRGALVYSGVDVVYFSLMIGVFAWIVAPPPTKVRFLQLSIAYRFIVGSVIGALLFLLIIGVQGKSFNAFLQAQGELFSSLYLASVGTDVVQRSLVEQYVTPEAVIKTLIFVALRGGGLVSCVLIFFMSRQISLVLTRLIRRTAIKGSMVNFHVADGFIWALSSSLLGVLLGNLVKISMLEILAWNMVTICIILYLAQGLGILLYFASWKLVSPFMRVVFNLLMIVVIFSPGLNVICMGVLILLGIIENWVPFRVPKSDRPSSTPGM
jgi:hypothetical protein